MQTVVAMVIQEDCTPPLPHFMVAFIATFAHRDVADVCDVDRHTATKSAAATGIFFGLSALSSKPSSMSSSMPIMRVLPHSAS